MAAEPIALRVGVIADVQWSDCDDGWNYKRTTRRAFRGALGVLEQASNWWSELDPAPDLIAQLGDLIDGRNRDGGPETSEVAMETAAANLRRVPCPCYNVIGNHELYNFDRARLAQLLNTRPPPDALDYYSVRPLVERFDVEPLSDFSAK